MEYTRSGECILSLSSCLWDGKYIHSSTASCNLMWESLFKWQLSLWLASYIGPSQFVLCACIEYVLFTLTSVLQAWFTYRHNAGTKAVWDTTPTSPTYSDNTADSLQPDHLKEPPPLRPTGTIPPSHHAIVAI